MGTTQPLGIASPAEHERAEARCRRRAVSDEQVQEPATPSEQTFGNLFAQRRGRVGESGEGDLGGFNFWF